MGPCVFRRRRGRGERRAADSGGAERRHQEVPGDSGLMTDMFDLLPPESGCEQFDCGFCGVLQRAPAVDELIGRRALPRKNLAYMRNWLLTSYKRQRASLARAVLGVAAEFSHCALCVESA
ncbi:uncharacterized protein METZ01_LOCUS266165, partial [marine metagenome]